MNRALPHEFALAIGGAIFGAISSDLISLLPQPGWNTIVLTVGALVLILYGFAVPQHASRNFIRTIRSRRWRKPRVGILGGLASTTGDGIMPIGTDIPPTEWKEEIRKAAVRLGVSVTVRVIPASTSFDSFDAVINPFGATYPEASFRDFPIYARLLEYVQAGGLFVNVADIPTYSAFNANLKRSIDCTPPVYGQDGQPVRFFSRVPLMEELAVRIHNYEGLGPPMVAVAIQPQFSSCEPVPPSLVITRAAIVEGNVNSVFVPLSLGQDSSTPLFFCPYGDGQVLCSLSFLSGQYPSNRSLVPFLADLTIHAIISELDV